MKVPLAWKDRACERRVQEQAVPAVPVVRAARAGAVRAAPGNHVDMTARWLGVAGKLPARVSVAATASCVAALTAPVIVIGREDVRKHGENGPAEADVTSGNGTGPGTS